MSSSTHLSAQSIEIPSLPAISSIHHVFDDKYESSQSKIETAETVLGPINSAIQFGQIEASICLSTSITTGLSSSEVQTRLLQCGLNEIKEKKLNPWILFLKFFTGPTQYLIEIAVIISGILSSWIDIGILVSLLLVNAVVGFHEKMRADNAIGALKSNLDLLCRVRRNGRLSEIPYRELVPGDLLILRLGDVVPADALLLGIGTSENENQSLSVDESQLTGESIPVRKGKGDPIFSGAIIKQGQMYAIIIGTGAHSFLGRTAQLMNVTREEGYIQRQMKKIGHSLLIATIITTALLLLLQTAVKRKEFLGQLQYSIVLTVAAIPLSMPIVLAVCTAVGAQQLASHHVIVKRLHAMEDMASMDILCSDKTGTLTLNELSIDEPYLADHRYSENDLMLYAFLASEEAPTDAIEACIRKAAVNKISIPVAELKSYYAIREFLPFDPINKYTRAIVYDIKHKQLFSVIKGAPEIILKICQSDQNRLFQSSIRKFASKGLRCLGVARSNAIDVPLHLTSALPINDSLLGAWDFDFVGFISLFDPPREDTAHTIQMCGRYGVSIKMITGDSILIAREVARRLGMHRNILSHQFLRQAPIIQSDQKYNTEVKSENIPLEKACELELIGNRAEESDGFAGVHPEDKFKVVELLQMRKHVVGMTGDGVNDAPALNRANIGIAVANCTDAARAAADIILTKPGLAPISSAILIARAVSHRIRSYALYRLTVSCHFLLFLTLAPLVLNYEFPPRYVTLFALINDFINISITLDNAIPILTPDKWRIGQITTVGLMNAICLTTASIVHYFSVTKVFDFTLSQLHTVLFCHISFSHRFLACSSRLTEFWWKRPYPSWQFATAIVLCHVFTFLIAIFGVFSESISFGTCLILFGIALLMAILIDLIKVCIYSTWSFELIATLFPSRANKIKLAVRKRKMRRFEVRKRLAKKLKAVLHVIRFLNLIDESSRKKTNTTTSNSFNVPSLT